MSIFEITDRVDNLEYKMSQLIETVQQTGRYIQTMAARQDKLEAEFRLYTQDLAKQSAKRDAEFQAFQERLVAETATIHPYLGVPPNPSCTIPLYK